MTALTRSIVMVLLSALMFATSIDARPKDPRRERARCDAALRLCKDVAGTDYRNCKKTRSRSCDADYREDIGSCNSDHRDCIDRID